MLILALFVVPILIALLVVAGDLVGRFGLSVILLLGSLAVLPKNLTGSTAADHGRSGIAGAEPQLMTYTVAIVIVLLVLAPSRARLSRSMWQGLVLLVPFVVALALWVLFVWPNTLEQDAGVVQYVTGVAAFGAGWLLASAAETNSNRALFLLRGVAVVSAVQSGIVLLQSVGIGIFPQSSGSAEFEGSRANGTFDHPSTLGKIFLALLLVVMPYTNSSSRRERKLAWLVVFLMVPGFVLTSSRANALGFVLMVVVWVMLLPGRHNRGLKTAVPTLVIVGVVSTLNIWIERFETGENGSFREHYDQVALSQIALRPLTGTGPNSYLTVVSAYDSQTAQGWPVHNIFLLTATELGLPLAVMFYAPFVVIAVAALVRAWRADRVGDAARCYVAFLPAFAVVGLTGWGYLQGGSLPVLMLAIGAVTFALFSSGPSGESGANGSFGTGSISFPLRGRSYLGSQSLRRVR